MIKKFILLIAALVSAVGPASSQTMKEVKKYNKEIQKQAEQKAKELLKEGYKCEGLDDMVKLLGEHIHKVRFGYQELVGNGNASSISLARKEAMANALSDYSTLLASSVAGGITTNEADLNGRLVEDIVSEFKTNVTSLMKGEVQESLVLKREGKKHYEFQIFYIVDHETAHALHMRALNMALDELELTEKYASKASTWLE